MAGPELRSYCALLNGCKTGEAKITPGFKLKSKWIIHAVGPHYGAHSGKEAELLYSCYQRSLELAVEYKIRTIAFPAISTGIYGFPKNDAAEIAYKTCFQFIEKSSVPERIFLVHFP
jgi:O-acetyl-ADP-ribose deacetylase (regulator of RNase III)